MESVLKSVLKGIVPSERDNKEIRRVLKRLTDAAEMIIKPRGLEKTIAGSFIRDTWLKDKKEIDLFIMFPTSYPRQRLEKSGIEIGKRIMKELGGSFKVAYADHPYVKGEIEGYGIDIVPCYKVSSASKIKSAVDRTPFHNKYIKEQLCPEMSNQVRLLKQFCKSAGVYGSDIRTGGFSGYLCELLIIRYKTFRRLVEAARRWEPGKFIDIKKHCTADEPKSRYRGQPLIVIDPTDPGRNVAAALSPKNFVLFVNTCKRFVENPQKKYFVLKRREPESSELRKALKGRGTEFIGISFGRPPVVDDILFSQMRKTSRRIKKFLEDKEFRLLDYGVFSDEKRSMMIFEMEVWNLPSVRKVKGPPIFSKMHSKQFTEKYGKDRLFVEGEYWVAFTERKSVSARNALKCFLEKSHEKLMYAGIRSHVAKSVSSGFRILDAKKMVKTAGNNGDFSLFMKDYLERKV